MGHIFIKMHINPKKGGSSELQIRVGGGGGGFAPLPPVEIAVGAFVDGFLYSSP